MEAVQELAPTVGIESACDALGMARASFYRLRPVFGLFLQSFCSEPSVITPKPASHDHFKTGQPSDSEQLCL